MLKIRRPLGRLIFNMGIAIPGKTVFLIETAPRSVYSIYHNTCIHIIYYSCILNDWNKHFLRDIHIPRVGEVMTVRWMIRYWYHILSCFVSNIYFNSMVLDSLYHDIDIGTMWHCAYVSCIPARSRTVFGCALFWCRVSLCVLFTNSLI